MKFDTAYCISLDDKLSIYDVRDLNFDETVAFDSDHEYFLCPHDACRAAFADENKLGTLNAKNVSYIRTPHFKDLPSTQHIVGCPYGNTRVSASGLPEQGAEAEVEREEHFPSELLLTRRQYVRKPVSTAAAQDLPPLNPPAPSTTPPTPRATTGTPLDKTSVFAHPVECFVSNYDDKERLKRMPLKIGEQTAPYSGFFKKIEYLQDNKGLIYWGKVKEIKDYTHSFRVDFEKKVWFEGRPYSVNVYLSKQLIEGYRKRKAFMEEIRLAIANERPLYCFFYGITPALKQVPSKKDPSKTFGVFSGDIPNLDHFLIREAPGLDEK